MSNDPSELGQKAMFCIRIRLQPYRPSAKTRWALAPAVEDPVRIPNGLKKTDTVPLSGPTAALQGCLECTLEPPGTPGNSEYGPQKNPSARMALSCPVPCRRGMRILP